MNSYRIPFNFQKWFYKERPSFYRDKDQPRGEEDTTWGCYVSRLKKLVYQHTDTQNVKTHSKPKEILWLLDCSTQSILYTVSRDNMPSLHKTAQSCSLLSTKQNSSPNPGYLSLYIDFQRKSLSPSNHLITTYNNLFSNNLPLNIYIHGPIITLRWLDNLVLKVEVWELILHGCHILPRCCLWSPFLPFNEKLRYWFSMLQNCLSI